MTKQKQIEGLGKIDGWHREENELSNRVWYSNDDMVAKVLPDYLHPIEGYVYLHMIINGMDSNTIAGYEVELYTVAGMYAGPKYLQVTVAQMAEAILKTYDKWEEE